MAGPIRRWFHDHPASVGESYPQHFGVAARFGATMIVGGIACFIHALVPALCTRTGSSTVKRLYTWLVDRQPGHERPAYEEPSWRPEYEI